MSRFFRGGPGFAKTENALKRADELIAVGQKGAALRALHDVLSSKRHRAAWTKVLESVGLRYVELCVDLRKGRYAKDGLIHYRNVCQQVRGKARRATGEEREGIERVHLIGKKGVFADGKKKNADVDGTPHRCDRTREPEKDFSLCLTC